MANEGNLKKFGSEREPREAGRKGGKASGEARVPPLCLIKHI